MKRIVKSLYILLVAIVVFTGVLLIFEGAKPSPKASTDAAVSEAATESVREIPLEQEQGSAI